jgi:hypothetical protein
MNHERSSTQLPCRLVWKRPAGADLWDAAWCRVSLSGSETGPERVTPRPPPVRAVPVPVDGAALGVVAAECHDGAEGADGVEPKQLRRATQKLARAAKDSPRTGQVAGPEQRLRP